MKNATFVIYVLVFIIQGIGDVDAAELAVKVKVLLKEKANSSAVPFRGIKGFSVLRGGIIYPGSSCPDPSDDDGMLTCNVPCNANADLQLALRSPNRNIDVRTSGYGAIPATLPLAIKACSRSEAAPIEFVFKSREVLLSELEKNHPAVYKAVVNKENNEIKSLKESSPALIELAKDPRNREAILQLSTIAKAVRVDAQLMQPAWKNLAEYEVGAPSVIVKAAAENSSEQSSAVVTADRNVLNKNIGEISKKLTEKPSLNAADRELFRTIQETKQR